MEVPTLSAQKDWRFKGGGIAISFEDADNHAELYPEVLQVSPEGPLCTAQIVTQRSIKMSSVAGSSLYAGPKGESGRILGDCD